METQFVYRMRTFKDALEAVEALDAENNRLLIGLGVMLLMPDNGDADWYVFGTLKNPESMDRTRILAILATHGDHSDYTIERLARHPHFGGMCSGNRDQIKARLRALLNSVNNKTAREMSNGFRTANSPTEAKAR
jgi:hypothetical protein